VSSTCGVVDSSSRVRKGFRRTSLSKHEVPKHCSYGPIVIERASTSVLRCGMLPSKAILDSKSSVRGSAIRSERGYKPVPSNLLLIGRYRHVRNAALNPVDLDERQVQAVATRIELDLRIGVVLTRFQTLNVRRLSPALAEKMISYGMYPRAFCNQFTYERDRLLSVSHTRFHR
jgi:hypothetical protein